MRYLLVAVAALVLAGCQLNPIEALLVEDGENAIVRVCGEIVTGNNPFATARARVNYVEIPSGLDVTGITPADLESILDCD